MELVLVFARVRDGDKITERFVQTLQSIYLYSELRDFIETPSRAAALAS